ncbi:MAG: serine/threonine protein kinase, partial [Verrucomicrobia bacterium]|nr:serine/threonine protein kinase [Verrucomicrobiota bacterium]
RFEAERQALAMMDHPNIAKVLDAGTTEAGRPFFVMELVRCIRITEYCDQNNLTTRERLDLFIKVCQAIQHAHQKGIIHRDIKPSNILVTMHDGVPVPKVIDFGIAKATEGRLTDNTVYTQLHQFIGTPAYMSPEQAEMSGLDIDTRSDIYSLGVLLYELLAGSTPFDAKELMASGIDAMRKTIREKEPVRPSTKLTQELVAADVSPRKPTSGLAVPTQEEIGADSRRRLRLKGQIARVRGDLDWIVMKCLEKDRTRRYETANGLAVDLKRHLNNEPVLARPPSTAYKMQKAIRRNKLVFGAGAAVIAALVAGLCLAAMGWRETRVERDNALQAKRQAVAAQKEAERSQSAETSIRREVEHDLYAAKMNLAQQAWDQNNIGRLRQLLAETQNSPYLGFEWYFWQPKTHLALKTLRGHLKAVTSGRFSPDGQRIVTGSWDKTAKVWDAASGKELLTLTGHSKLLMSVAFSPDGQRIVTGSYDGTAKVWEAVTGRELLTLKGHSELVKSVSFSRDGRRIVTGSGDGTAKVWDAATGKEL